MPLFHDSVNTFISRLQSKIDQDNQSAVMDLFPYFKYLTGDIIARCAMGQEGSCQDETNEYVNMFTTATGKDMNFKEMPMTHTACRT